MIFNDKRTVPEQLSHTIGVMATDQRMSGWGKAKDGTSRIIWACESDQDAEAVMKVVTDRGDMHDIQFIDLGDAFSQLENLPGHTTIWPVTKHHAFLVKDDHKP